MKALDNTVGCDTIGLKLLPTRHAARPRVGLFILGGVDAD